MFLLILSQVAFADCAGYIDEFDARVLDGNLVPIEGAEVWIGYDPGTSFGSKYYQTPVRITDSEGKYRFKIINQGTTVRTIDCDIDVSGRIGGSSDKVTVKANQHGPIIDVKLDDVFPVRFYVRDQYNAPVSNASVTVGTVNGKTNENGLMKFYYNKGTYNYLASLEEAKKSGTITIDEESVDFIVIFEYYDISLDVMDDNGEPLAVTLNMLNQTISLPDGHFEKNNTFGTSVPYQVSYKGIIQSGTIVPEEDPSHEIIFDAHAPTIGEVVTEIVNNRTKFTIPVSDEGSYASGVDVQSMSVKYKLQPADATTPWNTLNVLTSGYNTFSVEFPQLPPNSVVEFRIEVKDNAGNKATKNGKFSTLATAAPSNDTTDHTITQKNVEEPQGIPLFYILGGVIVVILAVIMVIKLRTKR
jgi:hypothetical protein